MTGCSGIECTKAWRLATRTFLDALRDQEVCICAAIRLPGGRVVRGHRHHHCFAAANAMQYEDPITTRRIVQAEQGFVTSRGRFVDRWEGRRLQDAAGVASVAVGGYRLDCLFSEDLY